MSLFAEASAFRTPRGQHLLLGGGFRVGERIGDLTILTRIEYDPQAGCPRAFAGGHHVEQEPAVGGPSRAPASGFRLR